MKNFYVYIYLDPRKPGNYNYGEYHFDYEPFYVGKGSGERWIACFKKKSNRKYQFNIKTCNRIDAINIDGFIPMVKKVVVNLTNRCAYKIENELIKIISNEQLEISCLTNKNYGVVKKTRKK